MNYQKKLQTNFSCSNNCIRNMKFIYILVSIINGLNFFSKRFETKFYAPPTITLSSHAFFPCPDKIYNKCENQNVYKRIFRLNSKNLKGLSLVIWDMWSYKVGETIKIQIVFIFILQTYISF